MKKKFNQNNISDVFFDLDHTLWDFEKNSALAFKSIFKNKGYKFSIHNFLKIYNPINHYYWKLYRENIINHKELRIRRLKSSFDMIGIKINIKEINEISEFYAEKLLNYNHLIPGAIELLKFLKKKYSLSIITNGFKKIQNIKVENSGLNQFFDNIITSEEVGFKKPDPIIFKKALEKSIVMPVNSVMIGDSFEADIMGALNFGMKAIHFNSHNEKKHNLCPIVYELIEIKEILFD